MTTRHGAMMGSLILLGLLALGARGESGGCGGSNLFEGLAAKDSREAKIEEARISLDTRDFTKAITILQEFCGTSALAPKCDAKTASLLIAAFNGRCGIDSIKAISVATTAAVDGFSTAEGVTSFSRIITSSTPASRQDCRDAASLASVTASTPDQNLQLALAAASNIIATLGAFTGGFTSAGLPNDLTNVTAANLDTVANLISQDIVLLTAGLANSGVAGADLASNVGRLKDCLGASPTGATLAAALTNIKNTSGTSCS